MLCCSISEQSCASAAAAACLLQENIRANLCKLLGAHPSVINIKVRGALLLALWLCSGRRELPHANAACPQSQAKTHEKVDSIGEERSIGCHAVIMLIRKDLA